MMDRKIEKCINIVQKDNTVISKASRAHYFPFVMKSGRGAIVKDMDGNKYIDMFSSSAVLNTGHSHPKIIQAIKAQVDKFIHFSADYMYTEPQIQLAEMLTKITPGNFKKKVCFGLSGSDGNDGAIKLARSYTKRTKIISFIGSYHGSTYGAISLSAISLNMRKEIGPLLPEIYHMPYPDCYRCAFGKKKESCSLECIEYMKTAFKTYIPPEEVAAIVIEPIAGDIGFVVPEQKYMKKLYDICKENGILFVVDEVQQGFGRTGKWFSIEHFGIIPDIVVMGKSIASGLPLSAVVAREEIVDALRMPAHLFTIQGNPVCAKASIATIEVIKEDNLIEYTRIIGKLTKDRFNLMKEKYKLIGDVRGEGLSIGVELVKDKITKEKDTEAAIKICYRCWEKGVILIFLAGNILRVQPPLVIHRKELNKALDIIEETIKEYIDGKISDKALEVVEGW